MGALTPATSGPPLPVTDRTRHRRLREQGSTERGDLDAILSAGVVCHLGVVVDGYPMVVPTVYGVSGDTLYLHGSVASRSLVSAPQAAICVPSKKELAATTLLALPLAEASVKIRTGPPDDGDSPDAALPVWAGVLPLAAAWQDPEPDPVLPPGVSLPSHIAALVRRPLG